MNHHKGFNLPYRHPDRTRGKGRRNNRTFAPPRKKGCVIARNGRSADGTRSLQGSVPGHFAGNPIARVQFARPNPARGDPSRATRPGMDALCRCTGLPLAERDKPRVELRLARYPNVPSSQSAARLNRQSTLRITRFRRIRQIRGPAIEALQPRNKGTASGRGCRSSGQEQI